MTADRACTDLDCTGIMIHVSGMTFTCGTCGRDWAPHDTVIDALDRLLCDLSLTDGPAIETVMQIALNEQPIGNSDPDEWPSLADLPAMLNLPDLDANVIVAWSAWRREYDRALAELVA